MPTPLYLPTTLSRAFLFKKGQSPGDLLTPVIDLLFEESFAVIYGANVYPGKDLVILSTTQEELPPASIREPNVDPKHGIGFEGAFPPNLLRVSKQVAAKKAALKASRLVTRARETQQHAQARKDKSIESATARRAFFALLNGLEGITPHVGPIPGLPEQGPPTAIPETSVSALTAFLQVLDPEASPRTVQEWPRDEHGFLSLLIVNTIKTRKRPKRLDLLPPVLALAPTMRAGALTVDVCQSDGSLLGTVEVV